ncbi:MAG: glycerol-3-phosphate 1-O-acyltransferase PlsY [Candidatus Aminicenantes bacterium]|nr:glycerol-3-phosphate 1-O-acyltransferase PlsY [Candidatus Aminicenantes bacterium]
MSTHEWTFLLSSFLLGSVPIGYLLCFLIKRRDIRNEGSGNIGATNVLRTLGPAGGAATLLLDFLKGALPVFYGIHHFNSPYLVLAGGAAAILGHMYSPFLKFRGGKGVSTFLGVFAVFHPWSALLFLAGFFAVVLSTRLVSAASLTGVAVVFFIHLFTRVPMISMIVLSLVLLIFFRHRRNINAIIGGTERRIRFGRTSHG